MQFYLLYIFAVIRCHKHIQKKTFFVQNQSSIYTFYTHKRVKKKFSLFFRQKMRTFDPHFRHSFLHLKRIEEVTQRPKNGKKSLNMECFPDWLEIRINILPTTTSFEYFFSSEKISWKHWFLVIDGKEFEFS